MSRLPLALHVPQTSLPVPQSQSTTTPVQQLTRHALSQDYDHVCVPLTNDLWRERWERLCLRPIDEDEEEVEEGSRGWVERERKREVTEREAERWRMEGGFKRGELNVTKLEETEHLIAMASDWLELDSPDEGIRFDSELALRQEILHSIHLSIPLLLLPPPLPENRAHLPSYARALASLLELGGESALTRLSIRIPVCDKPAPGMTKEEEKKHKRRSSMGMSLGGGKVGSVSSGMNRAAATGGDGGAMSWEMWDCIRSICGYHPRLSLTLDLSNPLPPSLSTLSRWIAEPTQTIFLPSQAFIPNAKGYPVLSKACQGFLRGFVKLRPTIILSPLNTQKHPSGGPAAYIQYVRHLESTSQQLSSSTSLSATPSSSSLGAFKPGANGPEIQGYGDWLQAPLQPLMDDLGSATYEVFERDPVKYRLYEEAMFQALNDRPQGSTTVVYVVGAGRGPLVSGCLRASQRSGRNVKVYAVEKNSSAFVTLQEKKATEWGNTVQIIFGDMRTIQVPELADLMVSELLGSFADNELSPECLDGAARFLKPDGISIPASYTAHLAPLSSSKLHASVKSHAFKKGKNHEVVSETPYVVMFQQVNLLSANPVPGDTGSTRAGPQVQECWGFEHPRRDMVLDASGVPLTNSHNTRSAHLTYRIPHAGALHGLAGYFEAHLYGTIGLSIHPERMHLISPEMMSWFPLFFPFKEPLYLPASAELDVHIWRLTDSRSRKVWYEWHAESFLPLTLSPPPLSPITAQPTGHNTLSMISNGSRNVSASSQAAQPSPMMDAPSPATMQVGQFAGQQGEQGGRVKIGQTGLHNPGGRSSWIGL